MNSRPKLTTAAFIDILRATGTSFGEDRVGRHAAALAYYTVFALSPMLVVIISIAALYFQDQAKSADAIFFQIRDTVGPTAAKAIQEMIQSANGHGGDAAKPIWATAVALLVALWGASGLFGALQDSLNNIWGVMPKPGLSIWHTVRERFISFAMVLCVGFLLLVSLVASTVLAALAHKMSGVVGNSIYGAQILNITLGLIFSTVLFAAIYKVLPDAKIQWRDVWVGAFVTAVLFTAGRLFLSWFLARPGTASPYGSAGALVVLLLWVNYAATILFVGAEFTKAYANRLGSKIEPDDDSIAINPADRANQGLTPNPSPGTSPIMAAKSEKTLPLPVKPAALPADPAKAAKQRQDFEYMMSVVGGAALVLIWAFRRQAKKDREVDIP
ncbi:YihY family inner membrane protein [bacterium]|nr:MAG: YihY family inner membrane protein [bacterium]